MLRLVVLLLFTLGCSDPVPISCPDGGEPDLGDASVGDGGVPDSCTAFCSKALVECEARLVTACEVDCLEGCTTDLVSAYAVSQECGDAFDAGFACVGDLTCDEFDDWQKQRPAASFPCRPEVLAIDAACN